MPMSPRTATRSSAPALRPGTKAAIDALHGLGLATCIIFALTTSGARF